MPRRFLQRSLPGRDHLARQPFLAWLSEYTRDHQLWHFGRRPVSRGAGMGMFIAFIPVPFQMVLVVFAAVWLRVNLPVAFAAILVTNPVTMAPAFYLTYQFGAWLLGTPELARPDELSLDWFFGMLGDIWLPLYLGSLLFGVLIGLATLLLTDLFWRFYVVWKRTRRESA